MQLDTITYINSTFKSYSSSQARHWFLFIRGNKEETETTFEALGEPSFYQNMKGVVASGA